jgi:hypothetical protein
VHALHTLGPGFHPQHHKNKQTNKDQWSNKFGKYLMNWNIKYNLNQNLGISLYFLQLLAQASFLHITANSVSFSLGLHISKIDQEFWELALSKRSSLVSISMWKELINLLRGSVLLLVWF